MNTNKPAFVQVKVSIKGRDLGVHSFDDDEVYIGRDPEVGVVLDNPGVSRHHAKLLRTEDGLQIVDLKSGNGTFVNEKQVDQAMVSGSDQIRISKFSLVASLSESPTTTPEPAHTAAADSSVAMSEGTVFLQPEERARVMEESRRAAAQNRATAATEKKTSLSSAALIFAAGTLFGLLCAWLIGD